MQNLDGATAQAERITRPSQPCPTCGDSFVPTSGKNRYCKPACRPSCARKAPICLTCGDGFVRTGSQRYCKPACRPSHARKELTCPTCGDSFVRTGSQRYCKPACRPSRYKGNRICLTCGDSFEPTGRNQRYCKPAHRRAYSRQPGRPGDAIYSTRLWRDMRLVILGRDPTCVWDLRDGTRCGQPTRDIDHIRPLRAGGPTEPSNLQGLCHSHHATKTGLERFHPDYPLATPTRCDDCGRRWKDPDHCAQRKVRARLRQEKEETERRRREQEQAVRQAAREAAQPALDAAREAAWEARRRDCEWCGDSFVRDNAANPGRFCSTRCVGLSRRKDRKMATCGYCGDRFILWKDWRPIPPQTRYCSTWHRLLAQTPSTAMGSAG